MNPSDKEFPTFESGPTVPNGPARPGAGVMAEDIDFGMTIRGFAEGQRVFGRYRLEHILGRGGMGVVWRTFDEQLERDVALKFMPEMVRLDPHAVNELKRETRRSLELTHPNIVRIHDFVQNADSAAISMEYVDGPTLNALRVDRPSGVFEPGDILEWVRQLCGALDYAHREARIIHRDLKPANLMVSSAGKLKVTDFGIARSISDSVSRMSMRAADASGTLAYMSPQQALGSKPSPADDIYSLGATLYDLLTGRPPFHSGNIYAQVREVVPPSMAERREELEVADAGPIPSEWEAAIAACLAKDPAARPASPREVIERLAAPAPARQPSPPVPVPKKRSPAGLLALLLVLAAGGGAAWYFTRPAPTPVEIAPEVAAAPPAPTPDAEKERLAKANAALVKQNLAWAQDAVDKKAYDDAERYLATVLAADPQNADALALRGKIAAARKQEQEAALARQRQELADQTAALAAEAIATKNWDSAGGCIDRLEKMAPQDARIASLRLKITDGRAAEAEEKKWAEALPPDLPASGFFDLDGLFASGPYAGYNRYSRAAILTRAQEALRAADFYEGAADGDPGHGTEDGIIAYQRAKRIPVSGRLDSATLASLGLDGLSEMAPPTPKPRPASESRPQPAKPVPQSTPRGLTPEERVRQAVGL